MTDANFNPGDLVWCVGTFENLYTPYRIKSIYQDGQNFFALILEVAFWSRRDELRGERMNLAYLSHAHPLGWKIVLPTGEELR